MEHGPILPILIPLAAAIFALAVRSSGLRAVRAVSIGATLALVFVAAELLAIAHGGSIVTYELGSWPTPYGIVLVVDRLSALMLFLTAIVGLAALVRASADTDTLGRHFHVFFQLELAGLSGAFLAGDLFNLFVCFEILLLASYALLTHGANPARTRAAVIYVVLNITGSTLFLVVLALLYGMLGTLNLADIAVRLASVPAADQAIVRTACALLIVVFLLKAAIMPLSLRLPQAYAAVSLPVAALFAIMTKVGIYGVIRTSRLAFDDTVFTADLAGSWLLAAGLATIVFGTLGSMAARRLAELCANLVLISTGILIGSLAASATTDAAALYYLAHTTLVTAALFLLAEQVGRGRGALGDGLRSGPKPAYVRRLGLRFAFLAVAVCGAPPLSGFLGKLMLLRAVQPDPAAPALWAALLISGFVTALVLARTASVLFWESQSAETSQPVLGEARPRGGTGPLDCLIGASLVLVLAAAPITDYLRATARQLAARDDYIAAVLGVAPQIIRDRRP